MNPDTYVADRLPPKHLWPEMNYQTLPKLGYANDLNVTREIVDHWAARSPDKPAIYFRDEIWRYRKLADLSNQICRVLIDDHGVVPGSRVLLRSSNHPWLVASLFAVWRAGAIAVPTMPVLRSQELSYIVSKAKVELAISQRELAGDIEKVRRANTDLKTILYFGGDKNGLERSASKKSAETYVPATGKDDVALIAFTSGTTGRPKATLHFQRDLLAVTDTFADEIISPAESDIFCGTPQIAFLYGLCGLVLDPMRFGAATVLEERLKPEALLDIFRSYRPTVCFTTPSAFPGMLRAMQPGDTASLRLIVAAGETLPDVSYERWTEQTGVPLINGLGVSELLHIFLASRKGEYRKGYVGPAVTGYQVKVGDENGRPKPAEELGYLFVKGPTGCRYLDDAEKQKAYIVDGWNRTGDLCRMSEDGFFAYVSRTDDMIVSAGYNISPLEIEETLLKHPRIKECAVIAVPDPERSNIVVAYVVLNDGEGGPDLEREIIEFSRKNLAPFKCPRKIVFTPQLPRTSNDKIHRASLRAEAS